MARQDLLEFLKQGLDALDFKGDVSLDWDKKSHSFVVDLVFYIENKAGQQMEDADGILSDEPIIAFSDAILIYDGKKGLAGYDADDFLACLAFDGKEGWSLAYGKAFLTYLQIIMDNGTRDLLKFFADDEDEVFELEWSDEEFSRLLKMQSLNIQDSLCIIPNSNWRNYFGMDRTGR